MADKKTTELTAAGTLSGTNVIYVVKDGNSRKTTLADIWSGGKPTAEEVETLLDAYYGNETWRTPGDTALTAGEIETLLDTYYGSTDWRTGGGGGGTGGTFIAAGVFYGAQLKITAHPANTASAWTAIPFAVPGSDPYGFAGTAGRLTIPTGVTRVRLTANIRGTADTSDQQWKIFKNGIEIPTEDGGFSLEQPTGDYANGGVSGSAILPCVATDYFELKYFTSIGGTPYDVNFTVEALTHSLATPVPSPAIVDKTASYSIADADLTGNVTQTANSTSAIVVTVPPGLVKLEPITIIRKNTGAVTFAAGAGVSILSADARLSLRSRYSSGTLVPAGSDVYYLVGDLV
jgi:hypothetical protein